MLYFSDFVPLRNLSETNDKIFIYHIKSPDPAKYNFVNALKAFFILADVRMAIETEIPDGEIPIFDMTNFTLKHLTKINLPVLRKYMMYTQVSTFGVVFSVDVKVFVLGSPSHQTEANSPAKYSSFP